MSFQAVYSQQSRTPAFVKIIPDNTMHLVEILFEIGYAVTCMGYNACISAQYIL